MGENNMFLHAFIYPWIHSFLLSIMADHFKEIKVEECRYTLKCLQMNETVVDKTLALHEKRAQWIKNATFKYIAY